VTEERQKISPAKRIIVKRGDNLKYYRIFVYTPLRETPAFDKVKSARPFMTANIYFAGNLGPFFLRV
jgi:hypothetical protein